MSDEEQERPLETEAPRQVVVWLDEAVLIIMLLLSVGGAVITDFSPQDAYLYWLTMIPLFGLAAIVAGWAQARVKGEVHGYPIGALLKIQALHWGGVLCTVIGVFMLHFARVLNEEAAALVMLLILGLATFLDGIRIGWRFSLTGVFLGVSAMLIALVEPFLPLVVGLAVLLIIYTIVRGRREARRLTEHA